MGLVLGHPIPCLHISRVPRATRTIRKRVPIQREALRRQAEPAPVPPQATQESRAHTSRIEDVTWAGNEARERAKCMHGRVVHIAFSILILFILEPCEHCVGVLRERRRLQLAQRP